MKGGGCMRIFFISILLCFFFVIGTSGSSFALDIPLGNKALNTGVMPGQGFNFITEAQYYYGNSYGDNGRMLKLNGKSIENQVFAIDFVAEWHTPLKIGGARYSLDVILPFVVVDVDNGKDNQFTAGGVGDIYVEPFMLAWSTKYVDSKLILGVNLPIGSPGITKDHFSLALTGAVSIFFDSERKFQLSLMPIFEWHAKDNSNNFTEGMDFAVKWGLGYTFLGTNTIGIIGYSDVLMTNDSGSKNGAQGFKAGNRYVNAVGIQYNKYVASINSVVCVLINQEFAAKNMPMGTRFHLTFVKMF